MDRKTEGKEFCPSSETADEANVIKKMVWFYAIAPSRIGIILKVVAETARKAKVPNLG